MTTPLPARPSTNITSSPEKPKTPSDLRHQAKVIAKRRAANRRARKARRVNRLRAR